MVELCANDTLGVLGPVAGDLEVYTLRVVLRAGNGKDLVAEDVHPRRERLRDGRGPRTVGLGELNGRPRALFIHARFIDLHPLERLLVGISAVVAAVCDVSHHGARVIDGPLRPVEVDGAASGHGRVKLGRPGTLVADDVRGLIVRPVDKFPADILCIPARCPRNLPGLRVGVEVLMVDAVGGVAPNGSVGDGRSGKASEDGELGDECHSCRRGG